ncbi:MAG: (Fe-S)-binding protein [Trueperaceae bacterium]|nr:(Fe-S)-binding protein [Trueperaceae bacterium]
MTYQEALETLEKCRYCLMCRHADPLSHVSFNEALTPHGIALTIYSEHKGLLSWNEDSLRTVFSETDAGVARSHCATDQPFSEAVSAVKSELLSQGKMPETVARLKERLEQTPSFFGDAEFKSALEQNDYALFISDEMQYLWPESVNAVNTLIKALTLSPAEITRGKSSGFLALSLGFMEQAKKQAKQLMTELEAVKAKELIVLSQTDLYTCRHVYAERLGLSFPEEVKVTSLLALLTQAYKNGKLSFKPSADTRPYAYIDPSQALRVKDFDSPRHLLGAILPGNQVELFWRKERTHPTGSGSTWFSNPELAEKLTRARLEDAQKQGAEVIYCEDSADLSQLNRYAADYGLELKGLYELLADHLG